MRGHYAHAATLADALRVVRAVGAKTVVFDVEPLVAYWDGGPRAVDRGVRRVLRETARIPGVAVVCFATNSARRPSSRPRRRGVEAVYLASALKPFRTAAYRRLPTPGVLVGDQVATDGILARRLGYVFAHCTPELSRVPRGPWLLSQLGRLVRPLLFRRS